MTELDEDTLAGLKTTSRERKLSTAERIAIYAFHLKGVPPKIIARTFGVKTNAIYYVAKWEHTAAHTNAKEAYDRMGAERVWQEVITSEQIESINEGMNKTFRGQKLDVRGYRRRLKYRPGEWKTFTEALPDAETKEVTQ